MDDDEDYALDVWAGVVPLRTERGALEPDERLRDGIPVSPSVAAWASGA